MYTNKQSVRQSMKPYEESDKVGSLCCGNHVPGIRINVVDTQAIFDFCNYFRGENAVKKLTHSAFRIRTDIA